MTPARFRLRADGAVIERTTARLIGRVAAHREVWFALDADDAILGTTALRDVAALRVIRNALPGESITLLDVYAEQNA